MCVHGLTRNAATSISSRRRLVERGMRVVAPDLPGPRPQRLGRQRRADYATPLYLAAMAARDRAHRRRRGRLGRHVARRPRRHGDGGAARARRSGGWCSTTSARASPAPRCSASAPTCASSAASRASRSSRRTCATIHEPFGKLTDAQWRHMAEHSAVKTEEGDYRQHYDPAIGRAFSWPLMVDIVLWHVWEKVACPVLDPARRGFRPAARLDRARDAEARRGRRRRAWCARSRSRRAATRPRSWPIHRSR